MRHQFPFLRLVIVAHCRLKGFVVAGVNPNHLPFLSAGNVLLLPA